MNEFMFKGVEYGAQETVHKALEDVVCWEQRDEDEAVGRNFMRILVRTWHMTWQPPPLGWLKCNVDGA